MDVQNGTTRFDQAASTLCRTLQEVLRAVPASAKQSALEIRLRAGAPIALTCPGQTWFLGRGSELHNIPHQPYLVTKADIADSVVTMCGHSVHTHQHEIRNGFISLAGGHRAGVCGTAVLQNGAISALRDITSVNLRIAREVRGAADPLIERVFRQRLCGILIAGPPSSGKTTILRDLARQLASGKSGRYIRVAVVDERCELGAVVDGLPQNYLGPACDILSGYPKGEGILMAVRTLSPQVVVCDEIGARDEVDGILDGLNCGVRVVATAHADTIGELFRREQIRRLIEQGAFEQIVLLGSGEAPGRVIDILEVGDLVGESGGDAPHRAMLYDDGHFHGVRLIQKSVRD